MRRFEITYRDPDTGEIVVAEKEFTDSYDPHFIGAEFWAKDWAYMKADKGPHSVREIKE